MAAIDVLITEDLVSPAVRRLAEAYRVVSEPAAWKDPAKLRQLLPQARSVMIRNQTRLTRDLLAGAPNLVAIGRVGVGLDNIDLEAARELGMVVIAPLDANAVSVAEFTIGLIIALARKIPQADRSSKSGQWDRLGCTGLELHGKTLTVLGFGRIGRLVTARARAFGMRVVVYDPYVKADGPELSQSGATLINDLLDALGQADFISAHLPLTPETRGIIDSRALSAMRSTAFFINTSRGAIVDESALLDALQRKQIDGAALDVRATEPPEVPNPFAGMDNVILTPHIASFTVEAQLRTFEAVCSDLDRVLRGQPPVYSLNR
jgi:D-3-phosphoglycerate dehydrogenase